MNSSGLRFFSTANKMGWLPQVSPELVYCLLRWRFDAFAWKGRVLDHMVVGAGYWAPFYCGVVLFNERGKTTIPIQILSCCVQIISIASISYSKWGSTEAGMVCLGLLESNATKAGGRMMGPELEVDISMVVD